MLPLRPVFDDDQLLGRAAREASKAWANGEPIGRNKYILATTDKALQL